MGRSHLFLLGRAIARLVTGGAMALSAIAAQAIPLVESVEPIAPLVIDGNHFRRPDGTPERFWGVNLVALYPTHTVADALAANLASRAVNLVRLHHDMRSSLDWNPVSRIRALATYTTDTRTPDSEAWDRFDYLNARLRAQGIYLTLSLHSSRRFLPGDVEIVTTTADDRAGWREAIDALGRMPRNLDLFKALPMFDERCAQLIEEFARRLLTHVNPYTKTAYGQDPQVVSLETVNEHSLEYLIVAGNRYASPEHPAVSYFSRELQQKWDAYATANGVPPCDIYAPGTVAQKWARGEFLRGLDRAYGERMKAFVRRLGCRTPIEYSNLWRGEAFQKLEHELSDVIEEHGYVDPLVPRQLNDAFEYFGRSTPLDKPYIVGELNQREGEAALKANAPYRTILPLAAGAYGGFNDWSGVVWFAWAHGDGRIANDGGFTHEERRPAVDGDMVGYIESDGMMLDHLRTAGLIFRRGLLRRSAAPVTVVADDPLTATNYNALMSPKYQVRDGWQDIHAVKRAFGPVPAAQKTAEWMTNSPAAPLVSDTNEIVKDPAREQLTFSAPQAEGFGGRLDEHAPAGLTHLKGLTGTGAATVMLVSDDGLPLASTRHLVISRTGLDAANREADGPALTVAGLLAPRGGEMWRIKVTRPRKAKGDDVRLSVANDAVELPRSGWHEAELEYGP